MDRALVTEARQLAIELALEAGALLRERMGEIRQVDFKGAINIVTDADRAAEKLILGRLRIAFPGHYMLGEEEHDSGVTTRLTSEEWSWLVDPLDGTTNYAHGYPHFAVSIGLQHREQTAMGVVYDPMRDELFVAEAGLGATMNDESIQVSATSELGHSLLSSGFSYKLEDRPENMKIWDAFMYSARGLRRDGAAALNLAWVAAGRLDGFWERPLSPWDMCAGALIVAEAGGVSTGYYDEPFDPFSGEVVADNGILHQTILETIHANLPLTHDG